MDMRLICFNDIWYPNDIRGQLALPQGLGPPPGLVRLPPPPPHIRGPPPGPLVFCQPPPPAYRDRTVLRNGPKIVELPSSKTSSSGTFYYSSSGTDSRYKQNSSQTSSNSNRPGNIYEQASDSGGSNPTQTLSRPWRQVNQDVSQRMLAAATDSPPQIPKRDNYHQNNHRNSRQFRPRSNQLDSSTDDSLEGDPPRRPHPMSDISGNAPLVNSANGNNNNDQASQNQSNTNDSPYYYYGGPAAQAQGGPPPPGPVFAGGTPVGFMEDGQHPMMMMPPCPPQFMVPPPMGPPPCFFDEQGGRMMHEGHPHPPPFMMPPPPPFSKGSPHAPQSEGRSSPGNQDMSLALVPFGAGQSSSPPNEMALMPFYHPGQPRPGGAMMPFMPPPFGGPPHMMHMHPMMMPPPPPVFMPPQTMNNDYADIDRMLQRKAEMDTLRYNKSIRKKDKESTCYVVCCKGHTQVLWIIIAIVLIGVILGLVLGLTLV